MDKRRVVVEKFIKENKKFNQRKTTPNSFNFTVDDVKSDEILFTGGIGDVLALESFFSEEKKQNTKHIYYACRNADQIIEILKETYNCEHTKIWTDFSKFFCFFSKEGVANSLINMKKQLPPNWRFVQDWSINVRFRTLNLKNYTGSSILNKDITVTPPTDKDYYTIVPISPNDQRVADRKISDSEWQSVIRYLEKNNLMGVIVNPGSYSFEHPLIINLTGKTNIVESIGILKKGKGYIGIDSSLSVLAAKLFPVENLKVKSLNNHLYDFKHIYYAPKNNFSFIYKDLRVI